MNRVAALHVKKVAMADRHRRLPKTAVDQMTVAVVRSDLPALAWIQVRHPSHGQMPNVVVLEVAVMWAVAGW